MIKKYDNIENNYHQLVFNEIDNLQVINKTEIIKLFYNIEDIIYNNNENENLLRELNKYIHSLNLK